MHETVIELRPTGLAEASAALASSSGQVLIKGAGTAADWAGVPEQPAVVLDTTGLSGVLAHNPADMTVEVRAGTPLSELNAVLAEHGQRVALDAPRIGQGATVGGLIATADAGPSALTYGSLRDLVIGATLVLADGTVAHSGGHVIKNVAGYDLTKLVHGSHGGLALLVDVVLRLHPLPEASATVRLACSLTDAVAASAKLMAGPLEPVAVEWFAGALLVRLEGGAAALTGRVARLVDLLAQHGDAQRLPEVDAGAEWAAHAALVVRPGADRAIMRLGTRPSRLAPLLEELASTLGADQPVAGLATGVATVALPAAPDTVARAHQAAHQVGGTSCLRSRPAGSRAPGWGPAPSSIGVLRAVKNDLDPHHRLGPGRLSPWLP